MYEINEENTIDVEVGLSVKNKDDEGPDMATGLDYVIPTPEVNKSYVKSSVMLPRGNSYARRKVIRWKRDADGNAVGTKNENPIHDTRKYCVEFDDGEVS